MSWLAQLCLLLEAFSHSYQEGMESWFECETYLGYTASRCPSQTGFSFRASCCVQSWESSLLQLVFSFFIFFPPFLFAFLFRTLSSTLAPCTLWQLTLGTAFWSLLQRGTADHKWAACDWIWTQLRRNKPCHAQFLWQSIKTLHGIFICSVIVLLSRKMLHLLPYL